MNLEEARNNIGAEVELDESTKPYTWYNMNTGEIEEHNETSNTDNLHGTLRILEEIDGNISIIADNRFSECYLPKHLKLKPQNYKIHVPTEEESKEAQELFFELGYYWYASDEGDNDYHYDPYYDYIFTISGKRLAEGLIDHADDEKQITLQDLREMVAKKKQTQTIQEDIKPIVDGLETSVAIQDFDSSSDEDKTVRVMGLFQDFEPSKEMTWEEALCALEDGRKVEFYNELCEQWWDISHLSATEVVRIEKFRIAPKRIYLNGNFTKEQLLQKVGEME